MAQPPKKCVDYNGYNKLDSGMKYPFLMRQLPMEGHVFRDFACGDRHMVAVTTAGACHLRVGRSKAHRVGLLMESRPRNSLLIS